MRKARRPVRDRERMVGLLLLHPKLRGRLSNANQILKAVVGRVNSASKQLTFWPLLIEALVLGE